MKFDFVIGNPPYQEETVQEISKTNGQAPRKNIFHYFQLGADEIAKKGIVLIYPAGRWIHRSGKGMEEFGLKQINDPKLKKVIFYPTSGDLFNGVDISDGVSIVIKDMEKENPGFNYVYRKGTIEEEVTINNPGDELIPLNPHDLAVAEKVRVFVDKNSFRYLHDQILPRSLFGIESDFISKNASKARKYVDGDKLDIFKEVKLFTNDKAGSAGRSMWFVVEKDTIKKNMRYISEWQVVVSSAHAGGQEGRDNQLSIVDNMSAFGRARVALASFKTYGEAMNFYNYMCTYIVRFMFLMTDEALTSLGKRVPDLIDYSENNTFIDFTADLDEQLYKKIGLTEEEIQYVENTVDTLCKPVRYLEKAR